MKCIKLEPSKAVVHLAFINELGKQYDLARRLQQHIKWQHDVEVRRADKGGDAIPDINREEFDSVFNDTTKLMALCKSCGMNLSDIELERIEKFGGENK